VNAVAKDSEFILCCTGSSVAYVLPLLIVRDADTM